MTGRKCPSLGQLAVYDSGGVARTLVSGNWEAFSNDSLFSPRNDLRDGGTGETFVPGVSLARDYFVASRLGPYMYVHFYLAPRWGLPSNAPRWGGGVFAPLRSREPRNVATSGKRCWIALGVNSLKHVFFFENRGHGAGQPEVKGQILLFFTMVPTEATQSIINVFFFFLDGL